MPHFLVCDMGIGRVERLQAAAQRRATAVPGAAEEPGSPKAGLRVGPRGSSLRPGGPRSLDGEPPSLARSPCICRFVAGCSRKPPLSGRGVLASVQVGRSPGEAGSARTRGLCKPGVTPQLTACWWARAPDPQPGKLGRDRQRLQAALQTEAGLQRRPGLASFREGLAQRPGEGRERRGTRWAPRLHVACPSPRWPGLRK